MTYDHDLRFAARMIVVLLLVNLGGLVISVLLRKWVLCAAFLIWSVNVNVWRIVNMNLQLQRDRNRLMEAALIGSLKTE